ncbi:MAG: DUF4139 domain-containing protein [Elusimicrobiota bacterium]|nr:MAG: DUF4139 domain-containing protein [Elusimicrobiota bacterium]
MKTLNVLLALVLAVPASALEVTVYNSNLGLVKETRPFTLKNGVNSVSVVDVAAQIDPTSVHFKSLTAPDAVSVLEQDFRYDLISQEKLLQRYLGKEIELQRYGMSGEKKELIKGVLLASSGGRILRVGDKLVLNPQGEAILPELPEGLLTKPTLMWQLNSRKAGDHTGEISYLTGGLSWNADYVLVVDKDDAKADLNAWVTVANNSGATYKDAKLKLVAGDVHRAPVPQLRGRGNYMAKMSMAAEASADGMTEKSFFEYHLYSLGRLTTLADNSSKQVEMASAANVPVRKLFTYDGAQGVQWTYWGDSGYWDPSYGLGDPNKKVSVYFEFENRKQNNLGIPLPKGRVRVYKKDDDGSLQLAGEDAIDHTPKDEKVRVKMGEAFDVVGERKRTNYNSELKSRRFEETFEIKLRNHKDADATVTVVEHLYRWTNWKIVDSSAKWTKKDAQTIEFEVPVKKDGEAVVTYTVRYTW